MQLFRGDVLVVTKRDFATFYGGKEIERLCGTVSKAVKQNLNLKPTANYLNEIQSPKLNHANEYLLFSLPSWLYYPYSPA